MYENTLAHTSHQELALLIVAAVRSVLHEELAKAGEAGDRIGRKKKMLSPKDIQIEFGLHWRTLQRWRNVGEGPAYVNIGRRVFYERAAFEKFLFSGQVQTTGYVE